MAYKVNCIYDWSEMNVYSEPTVMIVALNVGHDSDLQNLGFPMMYNV